MSVARKYDQAWKEALDLYLEAFLRCFFPEIHSLIDWSFPPENLETELQKIYRNADSGEVVADRLYQVRRKDTLEELWLFIHLEVQNQKDEHLPERMFVYHYRIRDARGQHPLGVAILGDTAADWRPDAYRWQIAGTKLAYEFNALKIWDWRHRLEELEAMDNPFALVILAHLQSQLNEKLDDRRYNSKWHLIRLLYNRGYVGEEFRRFLNLIDWFLVLPPELERRIESDISILEKEKSMPLPMSRYERNAIEKGRQEGRQEGREEGRQEERQETRQTLIELISKMVQSKFKEAADHFSLDELADTDQKTLQNIIVNIVKVETVDELRASLAAASWD